MRDLGHDGAGRADQDGKCGTARVTPRRKRSRRLHTGPGRRRHANQPRCVVSMGSRKTTPRLQRCISRRRAKVTLQGKPAWASAADQESARGQFGLGGCYLCGRGVEQHHTQAQCPSPAWLQTRDIRRRKPA